MEAVITAGRPLDSRRAAVCHSFVLTAMRDRRNAAFRRQQLRKVEAHSSFGRPSRVRRALRTKGCVPPGIVLFLLLASICAGDLWASDFYLARLGPAPLRFASAPANPKDFTWPIPLNPSRATTNSSPVADIPSPIPGTNSAIAAAGDAGLQSRTNSSSSVAQVTDTAGANPPIRPTTPDGLDRNPLSASNLLLVTPQMLADYFRANLDSGNKPGTNAVSAVDVPFTPPTPKPSPSSEAIYRTQ